MIGQFAQCMAVSTSSDPTGSYYMWTWGFGTSVTERVIGDQLKGEIRFQWRSEGLVCDIAIPL